MTIRYGTKAFVFKKSDRNESDRLFSVFTSDFGRLDIFAKAIRKNISKLRSGIDIFFMSEIEFIQGKKRKTLTDANVIEKFKNISKNLNKFEVANKIGQFLDNFIKGEEKDENMFNLVNEMFIKLNNHPIGVKSYSLIYYYFLLNALSLLGYHPEVQKCNICRAEINPYNIYFSNKSGGVICKNCLNSDVQAKKINSDIVKIMRLILKKEWQIFSKLKIETSSQRLFEKTAENYYLYILSSHSFKNVFKIEVGVL